MSDPHIPQPPVTLPEKLIAIGWGRNTWNGNEIRDICDEAAMTFNEMRYLLSHATNFDIKLNKNHIKLLQSL